MTCIEDTFLRANDDFVALCGREGIDVRTTVARALELSTRFTTSSLSFEDHVDVLVAGGLPSEALARAANRAVFLDLPDAELDQYLIEIGFTKGVHSYRKARRKSLRAGSRRPHALVLCSTLHR